MNSTSERIARLSPQKLALLKQVLGESGEVTEPIAVVGIGCRFAGAQSVADYWRLIRDRSVMTGEIPATRWDVDAFFDPTGTVPGKMTTRWGGFLENIDRFDASFFGISPREAEKMDPQHRLLLEVVWEALEYGGLAPSQIRESSTGVFVGVGGVDYSRVPVQLDNYFEQITAYSGTGNALSIAANRISYTLDLRGPSLAIDTACSSSLVAAHLAIRSLRAKECDTAIVGGVNAILTPETTLAFSQAHMLSADGKCRPFDDRANGYVRGEGCGVVILKRLSDAVSAGDLILGSIRGSAVNQDGMTSGITAPNGSAQVKVIREALRDAQRSPDDVSYVEAHGTATPLGDPIELQSLAEVFSDRRGERKRPCYVGSVKANVGHTETAAGMASLIKTILMFRHRMIPGQAHFEKLNRHIDLAGSRLRIAQESVPWDALAEAPFAGVSSFGFGGTNAHLVLEAPSPKPLERTAPDRSKHLFAISAKSPERLRELASRIGESIVEGNDYPLADACHTLAVGRSHFNHRLAIPAADAGALRESLQRFASGDAARGVKTGKVRRDRASKVAFLFTGQGSQFVGMGRQLFESHPVFRQAIERCESILAEHLPLALTDVMFEDHGEDAPLHQTLYTQPALFAVEYALSRLWRSFGVEPAVMIGHSIGDYAAACEAGVFSVEDGLTLIAHRARLVQSLPREGMMAAVMADRSRVAEFVRPYEQDVSIAVHNGPQNVVISGRTEVVGELLDQFASAGIKTKPLEVSHAMHSPLLDPILDEFERHAEEVTYRAPRIPLISSSTGQRIGDQICSPAYWREHLRHTVNFVDGLETLESIPLEAGIEIGPGTTLCSLASRIGDDNEAAWLPSLRMGRDDWDVMTEALAELYVRGTNVDWTSFDQPFSRARQVLPTYPFEAQSHWYDMSHRISHRVRPVVSATGDAHPLLGGRLPVAGDKTIFEVTIDAQQPAWLADHCVDQSPVVPAAAYIDQAISVAKTLFGDGPHELTELSIEQPLLLSGQQRRVVQVQVGPEQRGQCSFEVHSRPDTVAQNGGHSWTLHASGTLHNNSGKNRAPDRIDREAIDRRMDERIGHERFYEMMSASGLRYGPHFQVIAELQSGEGESLARLELDESLGHEPALYSLHPAILDGCLQSIAGVLFDSQSAASTDLVLPTGAEKVTIYSRRDRGQLWVHTKLRDSEPETDSYLTDIVLLDDEGEVVARIDGARVQRVSRQRSSGAGPGKRNLLYELRWHPKVLEKANRTERRWLVFADSEGLATEIATRLVNDGDAVTVVHEGIGFEQLESDHRWNSYQVNSVRSSDYEALVSSIVDDSAKSLSVVDCRGFVSEDDGSRGELAIANCSRALLMLRAMVNMRGCKVDRTVLVTRGGCVVGDDDHVSPDQAALWGLGRVAMVETPQLACRLVDLDPTQSLEFSADGLYEELVHGDQEDQIALRKSERYVARLDEVPDRLDSISDGAQAKVPSSKHYSLRLGDSAGFDDLHYVPISPSALQPGEVEIEVKSTGLNFSDVLKALGLYPGIKDKVVPLGIECAGVISRVGPQVDRFQMGQRVMGVAPYSLGSHATTAEYAVVPTPENLSDDEAATIPITFLTAHHALCRLARLGRGEKVLIHAGAGGVGQAAIQIAQLIGAEIFTTAGSERKRDFLRSLGVKHVMDSRSLEFADQIMDITSGKGVDVVLNSLPGDAITKSLSVLAAYGRFLEIGKTDIYQNRRIGLWPFQDNLSYFAIDLDRMLRQRPDEIRGLYNEVMPHFADGVYRPLPLESFPPSDVAGAFRFMAQRKNIGKVVVSFADHGSESDQSDEQSSSTTSLPVWEGQGTVLITGGLGAIGRQVAQWVIHRGGKHLAILSRRELNDEVKAKLDRLATEDISIAYIRGDVADEASLAEALTTIPDSFPPIRGVIHAAGVLDDGLIQGMDLDQLNRAMSPKTRGAWNLHRLVTGPLDFFVLFSSIAGTIGSPGQANYAAGNAFLDGLANLRHQLGLPATSIAWGPWDEEGMAADATVRRQLSERGMIPLAPHTAIDLLDRAIRAGATDLAITDISWEKLLSRMPGRGPSQLASIRDKVMPGQLQQTAQAGDQQLIKRLKATDPTERAGEIQKVILDVLADTMGIDNDSIDVDQPLASFGLDSLMGMELRSKLESKLAIEIPATALFDDPSVMSLSSVVAELFDAMDDSQSVASAADHGAGHSTQAAAKDVSRNGKHNKSPAERTAKSALVSLGGSRGIGTPLFCIHPIGGDLRCYDSVARAFRSRPVYGLRTPGLQPGTRPYRTIDEMIDDYVETIRESEPEGPYCLMGWSTGGIFGYEIARRLANEELPVQALVMIDTPLPVVFQDVDLQDHAKFLVDLVEFANYFAGTSMELDYEELKRQDNRQAIARVLSLGIEHRVLPPSATGEYLERLINVCKRHVEFLQTYRPPKCGLTVELLRPEDTGMLSEATGQSYADDLGWSEFAQLRVHQVPGHHFTMMTGTNAPVLADKIEELLGEAALESRGV